MFTVVDRCPRCEKGMSFRCRYLPDNKRAREYMCTLNGGCGLTYIEEPAVTEARLNRELSGLTTNFNKRAETIRTELAWLKGTE